MKPKLKILLLICLSMLTIFLFLFYNVGPNWEYVLPRRTIKVFAIILTGGAIAFSTVIFQTITSNRILTPSIIGLDSLYLLIQTFLIFVFGSTSFIAANKQVNFLLSVSIMVIFALLLYRFLFKGDGRNIYFLLLVGIVFGTLFGSLSTFMQVLIDPNEFMVVQDRMFASFNNVNTDLLWLSLLLLAGIGIYVSRFIKYLDVISLGKEQAINLGVPYNSIVKKLLIIIAILVSISTALVGPITFLGLLVANITYEFMKTYRHQYILAASVFISILSLVGGQLIVERVFTFSTTLSVIINFTGGVYFIYLLLRESKSWSK